MENEGDGDTNCNRGTWNGLQGLESELEELENHEHTDYNIVGISQNTEKSPGDLRGL